MSVDNVPGYEKLVTAIIERYEEKQDRLERSMQEFKDTSLVMYANIESDVKILSGDVSYLVKVIRDGNDPISSQIVDHESRLSALEERNKESAKKNADVSNWKRAAITSIIVTLISATCSVAAIFFKK